MNPAYFHVARPYLIERRVMCMMTMLVYGIITGPVVGDDVHPSSFIAVVTAAGVEEVAVEEDCVARFEFDELVAKSLSDALHATHVCTGLLAHEVVVDSAEKMRARNHLG